ncbi:MAG TPA: hypothetical protein VG125_04385 [Pirellulales bacterium]|nr:hypothetical protein [Pirellulales bacterium]
MIRRRTTRWRGLGTLWCAAYWLAAIGQTSPAAAADGADASAQPSTEVTLRGHVLLPDGKPAAGGGSLLGSIQGTATPQARGCGV